MGEATVELSMENTRSQQDWIVAQITLNCNGTILPGEQRSPTINSAIQTVTDTLGGRVRSLKGRLCKSEQAKRSGKSAFTRDPEATAVTQSEESSNQTEGIAHVKRFSMKSVPLDEAID